MIDSSLQPGAESRNWEERIAKAAQNQREYAPKIMPRGRLPKHTPTIANPGSTQKPSALARSHNISASTESDIRSAFLLFASRDDDEVADSDDDDQGPEDRNLPSTSLRPALKALGIKPSKKEFEEILDAADPDDSGEISYEAFMGVAALLLERQSPDDRQAEVDEAFNLFLGEGRGGRGEAGDEQRITMDTLKRVAKVLKEDVDEQ
ncbi:MAG: hypothetical protein Q9181_008248, partial [Wetmoreana brouardii]